MASRLQKPALVLILGLCCLIASGCGGGGKKRPPLGKVKGKITYKGAPVPDVEVAFMAEGAPRAGTGTTNGSGEYQLTTYDTNDGAIVGTHKVTVTQFASGSTKVMSPADLASQGAPPLPKGGAIPAKYADAKTSGLKNTVDPGSNEINIELTD